MAAGGGAAGRSCQGSLRTPSSDKGLREALGADGGPCGSLSPDGGTLVVRDAHWSSVVTSMESNRERSVHYPAGLSCGGASASLCQADVLTIGKGHVLSLWPFEAFHPKFHSGGL